MRYLLVAPLLLLVALWLLFVWLVKPLDPLLYRAERGYGCMTGKDL